MIIHLCRRCGRAIASAAELFYFAPRVFCEQCTATMVTVPR